ncbi:MAG: immunoglobulin domain-containing protein [Phycisphaerae bacterium]
MTLRARFRHSYRWLACALALVGTEAARPTPAPAAVIGVLSDGRQAAFLSLLGDSSVEARTLLTTDGHSLVALASLSPSVMQTVDVVWMPVMDPFSSYTAQERTDVVQFVTNGGAIVFIGGADVFNAPDDSFLPAFGLTKLEGNLTTALTTALPDHPSVTGPFGTIGAIGSGGGYGLFASSSQVADVFTGTNTANPPETGTLAGFLDATTGFAGTGRAVFICDASMFGQWLNQDAHDHAAYLRNVVAWAARDPGYTPNGTAVSTGVMTAACAACIGVEAVFETVTATGVTTASALGSGRCGFGGGIPEPLPASLQGFIGYAFALDTTAAFSGNVDVTVTYDPAMIASLGVVDESTLILSRLNPDLLVLENIPVTVDTTAKTITGQVAGVGTFLFGAVVNSFTDCDGNGTPDECQAPVNTSIVAAPVEGGAVSPGGTTTHAVCDVVSIDATVADGYCFSGWTVSPASAAPPADPAAPQTTVDADVDKTLAAGFTKVIQQDPASVTVCEGAPVDLAVQVHADFAPTASYQWRKDAVDLPGATSSTYTLASTAAADAGDYDVVVTAACGSFTSAVAAVTVDASPAITTHPAGTDACIGDAVTLSVVTTGAVPLTYQWRKDGVDIVGATDAVYTIDLAGAMDAAVYNVVVTNTCGSATSDPAALTVGDQPVITTQPAGSDLCAGDPLTLSVSTGGSSPLTYQWRRDGTDINGATASTLTIDQATADDAGTYVVVVTNLCGSVVSESAIVTVTVQPSISTQPAAILACAGDAAVTLDVSASGTPPLSYQWRLGGIDIAGAVDAAYTISGVALADAGDYDVVITNSCGSVTSDPATLTVNPLPQITGQPADAAICPGATTLFTVQAIGAGLVYQWSFQANGQGTFSDLVDGPELDGANQATLNLTNVGSDRAGDYRCTVFSDCGLPLESAIAVLGVTVGGCDCNNNGTPDAQDIAAQTSTDCNGDGIPDDCQLAGADCNADGIPDACQLDANDCNADGIPDDCQLAGADCNADGIPDTCQLDGNDCNANGVPDDCEPPFIANAGPDQAVCVGVSRTLDAPVVGGLAAPPFSFFWQLLSGPTGGLDIAAPSTERPVLTASAPGIYEVELRVSNAGAAPCLVTDVITVTARQLTVEAGTAFSLCATTASEPLAPVVIGGEAPFTYAWTIDAGSPSTAPEQFTGTGPQSASPTFTPDAPGVYTVRVTVTDRAGAGCTATDSLTLTANLLFVDPPSDFTMCIGGESAPLAPTVSAPGGAALTYAWTIEDGSSDTDTTQFRGSGMATASPTFQPTSVGQYTLRVTVTGDGTPPCETSATVHVSVGSLTVDAGNDAATCVGGGSVLLTPTVTGGFGELRYAWTIEEGSPSLDPTQFTEPHAFAATPRFVPASRGSYTLRVTVTDSATPSCAASDTLVVRVTELTVDAGEDFVTRAFRASRGLGALPLVAGGRLPYAYEWTILGGPSTDPAQLSDPTAAHPLFTPAAVGTYLLEVAASEIDGPCGGADTVAIDVIVSKNTLIVNDEGRVFMPLRIDEPHTGATLRISEAQPGAEFTGEIRDEGAAASATDMADTPRLTRRLTAGSTLPAGSFVAVIAMYYGSDEVTASDAADLRLHWLDGSDRWRVVGTTVDGDAPFPLQATHADLGRHGVDTANRCAWAVLDHVGRFAVGIPQPATTPASQTPPPNPEPTPGTDPSTTDSTPPLPPPSLCGAVGTMGTSVAPAALLAFAVARSRRRRRTARPR